MADALTESDRPPSRHWRWLWLVPLLVLGWILFTASGQRVRRSFFASLRIARPQAVHVSFPAFSGPNGTHRLQDAVAAMVANSVHAASAQADTSVSDAAVASRLAGFRFALPAARTDTPSFTVEGSRGITMKVDRSRLLGILREAAVSHAAVPASVNGAKLVLRTPAAILARYGHCPVRRARTLTDQIAQRPPPSTDYGDCMELLERPDLTAQVPAGLDMGLVERIALQVAGMSPNQSTDFQRILSWRAALTLRMPRFIRSYRIVRVHGARAMLLNTAGRRQPTYELIWTRQGRVYTLAGYGNVAAAMPLAASVP